jgi:quinol monooxygenase YgiN
VGRPGSTGRLSITCPTGSTSPQTARVADVIVVNRFRVAEADAEGFAGEARAALAALADRPGYESGHLGRNVDDPALWVLTMTWRDVGSYRRALSAYDVKVTAVPLLSRAIDEPSAYELVGPDASALNQARPRTLD